MYKLRCILLLVFVFGLQKIGGSAAAEKGDDSSETTVGDVFPPSEATKPPKAINAAVKESCAIIMLGGKVLEIGRKTGRKTPKAVKFFNEVSRLIRNCLRKFKSRNETMRNAVKCLAGALGNGQGQEENAEKGRVPPMQTCLRDTTVKAVAETGSLMMEALNRTRELRELLRQAGERLSNCARHPKPFECAKGAWAEVSENAVGIPEGVAGAMLTIREAYANYMDDITLCMTPVEESDNRSPLPSLSAVEESKIYGTTTTEQMLANDCGSAQSGTAAQGVRKNVRDEKATP